VTPWDRDLLDPFLSELPDGGAEDLARAAAEALVDPTDGLRAALLAAVRTDGRFDRFAAVVADLLDVSEPAARAMLDGIARADVWVPGPVPETVLYHVSGGPKVEGHVTGFLRLGAGKTFPDHEHLGDERQLVIQGSFVDGTTGVVHRSGDVVFMPAGTAHAFTARPGPALVSLVVLATGVRIGGQELRAEDPRL
jgi:hypothetical protein